VASAHVLDALRNEKLKEREPVNHLILVAGNISTGKTTLTERVGNRLGWRTAFESVGDNPYLSEFYGDMRAWAFHLQVFFLGHRAHQHLDLAGGQQSAIADRSIYEDAHIFARALHHLGNLNERDYKSYRAVYDLVVAGLPNPDLLLYLRAPVEVLIQRIRKRGRAMERTISAEYLRLLDRFYEEWLAVYNLSPVLTVRTDDLDFVHRPEHLDIVVERIRARLAGREEIVFH
jgi:deoxyadenosine/deoxycytidine kinase